MHDKSAKNNLDKLLVSLLNLGSLPRFLGVRSKARQKSSFYLPGLKVLVNDHIRDDKVVIFYISDMKMKTMNPGGNIYGN